MSIMKENHRNSVWYGDIYLIEKCAIMSGVIKKHPQDTIQCILNALDKSPLFIKGYIVADVSGKKEDTDVLLFVIGSSFTIQL